jgi:hypothetical protein
MNITFEEMNGGTQMVKAFNGESQERCRFWRVGVKRTYGNGRNRKEEGLDTQE